MAGSSLLRLQSDERLVALVRDGHDPAFAAVVGRYESELQRYAARIVGPSRAEDVVQQAFLNAHTALVASADDIQLRPWLYRIAHNAGLNVLRSSREEIELDERLAAGGDSVEHEAETRERLQAALAAIARLPEPQRDALTLRALEGRSHAEIAGTLGVSPGTARQHVHRARATVRAVVSAVTPYGLMMRLAMAGGGEPVGASVLGGAGIGATAAKLGAGVLAAGAVATGTAGRLPFTPHHVAPAPAAAAQLAR
ncbi:MAG: RNA polymerase sigma factor, partial [Solirubrobacteraceae bacterium]